MYGVGPNVANVTANGEQIVRVIKLGSYSTCIYEYDNSKNVNIKIKDGKITKVSVLFYNENEDILWCRNYDDLTEEEKEKYLPEAEYEFVTEDAIGRYKVYNMRY